jgi:hypothetical protein
MMENKPKRHFRGRYKAAERQERRDTISIQLPPDTPPRPAPRQATENDLVWRPREWAF